MLLESPMLLEYWVDVARIGSGTKLLPNALNGRRRRGAHKARLELLAMGSVVDPLPRRGDPLAGNHRGVADDSGQVAVAPRLDAFSASWNRSTRPARTCGAPLTRCRAPLGPHAAQPRPDVNPGDRLRHRRVCNSFGSYRGAPGEQRQDVVGQESRPWSYRVAAAEAMLVGAEEPQRLNQMQMLLARVMATYSRRRSSSICAGLSVAISEGMQPSTRFST